MRPTRAHPNDPDVLAGQTDVAAPDGPNDEINTGYLWDSALRAGLTVRNYGFFVDGTCYNEPACARSPGARSRRLPAPSWATRRTLLSLLTPIPTSAVSTTTFPDYYRFTEWEREFDANYAKGGLPSLSLVRLMHDHTGNFATAIDLVNTPETDASR